MDKERSFVWAKGQKHVGQRAQHGQGLVWLRKGVHCRWIGGVGKAGGMMRRAQWDIVSFLFAYLFI